MHIIIVGNGTLGNNLAEFLSNEGHDIVIIEQNAKNIKSVTSNVDCMAVRGNCSSIDILREAGAEDADLLIACTGNDEMNMICCLLASKTGTKNTIARIRNVEYADELNQLCIGLDIDAAINPEYSTAVEISHMLKYPLANGIDTFAEGRVEMVEFKIEECFVNKRIADIKLNAGILFAVVERNGNVYIPNGDLVFEEGDSVYIIGESSGLSRFFKEINRAMSRVRDIMIVGGSRIALYLALMVAELGIYVKIIEKNPDKCVYLNERLSDTVIIEGDGTDEDVLKSEGVGEIDTFIALTNNDEENLITSMIARDCGADKVIAKINRSNFSKLTSRLGVDSVVNPTEIIDNSVLRFVRTMNREKESSIKRIYRIAESKAEAIEFDAPSSAGVLNKPLSQLRIKSGILVSVLVRGKKIIIPRGNDMILKGDRVVVITNGESLYSLDDIMS